MVPGKRVVWHVSDSRLNFVKDKTEWTGLVPTFECYGGCSGAWRFYINDSLQALIATGQGKPIRKEISLS